MPITFVGTGAAHLRASLELGTQNCPVLLTRPGDQACGEGADVRTVEAEADALAHSGRVLLLEAGICAGGTDIAAFGGSGDERKGLVARVTRRIRMSRKYISKTVHLVFLSAYESM